MATINSILSIVGILLAAIVGYFLGLLKLSKEKRLEFINQQLSEFYSPMIGIRLQIRTYGELRVEISGACNAAWHKFCRSAPKFTTNYEDAFVPYKKVLEEENKHFKERVLPLYDEMLNTFKYKFWLADRSTRKFYKQFNRFVELWHRYIDGTIPPDAMAEIELDEATLHPFYEDLERHLDELVEELSQRKRIRYGLPRIKKREPAVAPISIPDLPEHYEPVD